MLGVPENSQPYYGGDGGIAKDIPEGQLEAKLRKMVEKAGGDPDKVLGKIVQGNNPPQPPLFPLESVGGKPDDSSSELTPDDIRRLGREGVSRTKALE